MNDHETPSEHVENHEKCNSLKMRPELHKTIVNVALLLVDTEKQKRKHLSSRSLEITAFLA